MEDNKTYHFNTVWTMEKIRDDFKKFNKLTDLKNVLGRKAWDAAVKWDKQYPGFLDDVAGHIKRKVSWTYETLLEELENAITLFINTTGFPPTLQTLRSDKKTLKIISGFKNIKYVSKNIDINLPNIINQILTKLGLQYPKESGYIVYGAHFQGFYEAVGFCFMKSWGLNVDPQPKIFDKYKSDGYLIDYDIYWEHWGELNKNNPDKKRLYEETNTRLISTYNNEVYKKGIEFYYYELKNLLITSGVIINFSEEENFNPLTLVKGVMVNLEWIYNEYKEKFANQSPTAKLFKDNNSPLIYRIRSYFGGLNKFVEYCNENFNEEWVYNERNYDGDSIEYVIQTITPIIIDLKRFPTANELRNNKLGNVVDSILKYHGGLETFKRNEYEEGVNFKYVYDILGENTPYDKTFDFSDEKVFDWAVNFIKQKNGGVFPKYSKQLLILAKSNNCKVSEYFYYSIRKNGNSKFNTWSEFQEKYFKLTDSKERQFKESNLKYEDFVTIINLLAKGYSYSNISKITGYNSATIGRIKRKERFLNFYDEYYKEYMINNL